MTSELFKPATYTAVQQALLDRCSRLGEDIAYLIAILKRQLDYITVIEACKGTDGSYRWHVILQLCGELPEYLIRHYEAHMDFRALSDQWIPEDIVAQHMHEVDRLKLCSRPGQFSEVFMLQHRHRMDWRRLCGANVFSNELIRQLYELNDSLEYSHSSSFWRDVSCTQSLDPEIVELCRDELCWNMLLRHYKYPVEFLERHMAYIRQCTNNWTVICIYQDLTMEFMEQHAEELDWAEVASFQKFTDEFLYEHIEQLPWRHLRYNRYVSAERKKRLQPLYEWLYTWLDA
jgi:hypothetical protein